MILLTSFVWVEADWLYDYITQKKGKAIIIDVRTPAEHSLGYIPGTRMLIPHSQIASRINEINADPEKDTIIVYCRSGNRASMAAKVLESKGFKNVLNLKGGILEWTKKGYGLVKEGKKGGGR